MNTLPLIAVTSVRPEFLTWLFVATQAFFFLLSLLMWLCTRRNIENFTPSAFQPSYRPSRLIRFLLRCSGVHPHELAPLGAGAHLRHAVVGAMMFVPATMAFLGVSMWVSTFAETGPLTRNLMAAIGATLVFLIDLGVMTSLSAATGRRAAFSVTLRVSFALVVGYFVAKPFVVAVYKDEIARLQREKKRAEVFEVADKAHDERAKFADQHRPLMDHFRTAKGDIQRRMESLAPRRQTLQQRHIELNRDFVTEVTRGQNGRPDGEGKYAKFIKAEMEKVSGELNGLNAEEAVLKAESERLAKEEEATVARVLNDPKFSESEAAFNQLMREAKDSGASSLERQNDLVREYVAAGGSSRWWGYVLWHFLFILADTVPVLTKLTMLRRDFLLLAGLREKRLEAEVNAESEKAEAFAIEEVGERHKAEIRRMKLRALFHDTDFMYQAAVHLVLRPLQVETEARKAYHELVGRRSKKSEPDDSGWDSVSKPLRDVHEQILARFEEIIRDHDANEHASGRNGSSAHSAQTNGSGHNGSEDAAGAERDGDRPGARRN